MAPLWVGKVMVARCAAGKGGGWDRQGQ
ncbi:hypothetical protein TorRG33x02_157130 [Trema orientale]|uniref:Uncharacterized protein n=1 Tax=Trema orientale TaxID=63057 RepID=A0A2P5ESH5_TREOI|nr:hypothetical protein TorRG33x02_157130 [Trema orientale]